MQEIIQRNSLRERENFTPFHSNIFKEFSFELRNRIWKFLYEKMKYSVPLRGKANNWKEILRDYHTDYQNKPIDEFAYSCSKRNLKDLVYSAKTDEIFSFLKYVLKHRCRPKSFHEDLAFLLKKAEESLNPPRVDSCREDDVSSVNRQIKKDRAEFLKKFLSHPLLLNFREHFSKAKSFFTKGEDRQCVRESFLAVESIIRSFSKDKTMDFSESLNEIANRFEISSLIRDGFLKSYAYLKDNEKHFSLFRLNKLLIDHTDAQFVMMNCESFIKYLIFKSQFKFFGRKDTPKKINTCFKDETFKEGKKVRRVVVKKKAAPKKKAVAKKVVKKAAPKKKAVARKVVRKAAPKKKAVAKKVVKKAAPKKKAVAKKVVKKAAPKKKAVAKKVVKKAAPKKKAIAKKVVKKAAPKKKAIARKVVKKAAPKKKAVARKVVKKAAPKKKRSLRK